MVPADSRRISRVPRYSGAASALSADFRVRGFHPLRPAFPRRSPSPDCRLCRRSYNPGPRLATGPVWAGALSLATTRAIVVTFSSSGYLDVSVPRVRPRHAPGGRLLGRPGCPIRKSAPRSGYLPLRAAYRSLSRPSSPPRAKASSMRPCRSVNIFNSRDKRHVFSPMICSCETLLCFYSCLLTIQNL